MNIARLFSYTLEVERQRDELRLRVSQLEAEAKQMVDGIQRAANKQPVFDRPEPTEPVEIPSLVCGPTAIAAAEEAKILKQAEVVRRNGNSVDIPAIPNA